MPEFRLNQFLSRCGVASRRHAEDLIAQGLVVVNGVKANHPGMKIDSAKDSVTVRGQTVHLKETHTIVFHKPKGVICTRKDPQGRTTLFDLLPSSLVKAGIQSVGRLDFDSSGLLILTNDGNLHRNLEHPSFHIKRTYQVKARGHLDNNCQQRLLAGVELDDGPAKALEVKLDRYSGGISRFKLVISEGRNREVRRLCQAVGLEVMDLKRTSFGPIQLEHLPPGKWRELIQEEMKFIAKISRRQPPND